MNEMLNVIEGNWSPAARIAAGLGGAALMANCLAQRTVPAALLGTLGFGLFVKALVGQFSLGGGNPSEVRDTGHRFVAGTRGMATGQPSGW